MQNNGIKEGQKEDDESEKGEKIIKIKETDEEKAQQKDETKDQNKEGEHPHPPGDSLQFDHDHYKNLKDMSPTEYFWESQKKSLLHKTELREREEK